jgi:hypothetical protein
MGEHIVVLATPDEGVKVNGEWAADFADLDVILRRTLQEAADKERIPAHRLYWRSSTYLGGGSSHILTDR